jgi:antitoxin VapB
MGLNIKTDEAHRLAQELATLTGETMTAAVTQAIRERLERIRRVRDDRLERILAIGRDCAARLKEPLRASEIDDLYDEDGLPR